LAGTQNKFGILSLISLVAILAACQENKSNSPLLFKLDRPAFGPQTEVSAIDLKPEVKKQVLVNEDLREPRKSYKITTGNKFKIGVLLPLSGKYNKLGKSLLKGMELSFFELGTKNQALLIFDTMGTIDGARSSVRSAIKAGVKILVGPVFAAPSSAVASEKIGESLISISLSNDLNASASNAFVMGFFPSHRVQRVVSFAAAQRLKRFAALLPDDGYGDFIAEALREAVAKVGGAVVRIERYSRGQQETMVRAVKRLGRYNARKNALERRKLSLRNMKDPKSTRILKRLNDLETFGAVDFDAVLLIEKGRALTALAALLPYYDIDIRKVRILGIMDWSERSLIREPALKRAWYVAPAPMGLKIFKQKYEKTFGSGAHPLGPLAYDAMAVAVFLGRDSSSPLDMEALTNSRGFLGSAGLFRFKNNGLVERNYSIFEVSDNGALEISRARRTFFSREIN